MNSLKRKSYFSSHNILLVSLQLDSFSYFHFLPHFLFQTSTGPRIAELSQEIDQMTVCILFQIVIIQYFVYL